MNSIHNSKIAIGALLLTLLGSPLVYAESARLTLTVEVTEIDPAVGQSLYVALCNSASSCKPKAQKKYVALAKLPVHKSSQSIDFAGIKPGEYGLMVFHDEDGNGKLNLKGMKPAEGAGFSNEVTGKPTFGKLKFNVDGNQKITIPIIYPES